MSTKKLLKGAFILASAGLLAKFLGIFFKIPLQRLIHDEGMGLFGLPYPIYTVMLSISIIGFPAAISKLISEKLALEDSIGAQRVFKVSLLMSICIGTFTSGFMYLTAPLMIHLLAWPRDAYYSIVGLSLAPFFVSIVAAFRGYFQGQQLMVPTAISQIIEQVGRVVIGVGLAYFVIDRGIGYAAGAASFGATAGAFLATIVLLICYFKSHRPLSKSIIEKKQRWIDCEAPWPIVKRIVWIAIPITIGAVLSSIMGLVDAVMVPTRLLQGGYTVEGATVLYGQLTGKAVTLMNVPLTFSMAMAASLVPAISESFSRKNHIELQERALSGIKATMIIAMPATFGLFVLSPQIVHLLWGQGEAGGEILRVLAFNVVFIALAQTLTSILQGMNKVFIPVRSLLLGVVVKIIVSYILLVGHLNIIGAAIGSICGYICVGLLNLWELKRTVRLKFPIGDGILKPLLGSGLMVGAVHFSFIYFYRQFNSEGVATLLSICLGVMVYFICIFITGGLSIPRDKRLFFNK